jgi:ribosomal protein L11 methyltransferase
MTNTPWHGILIEFSSEPPVDSWDYLVALVSLQLNCQGVQDLSFSPSEILPVPKAAMMFFAPDAGTLAEVLAGVEELAADLLPAGCYKLTAQPVENEDWGKTWRRFFRTTRIGDRVYVGPPWENRLPDDAPVDAILVQIDPGQAFGTGSHETTRLCLQILEKQGLPGKCLLDVGTGSGILAFAAIMLGMSQAIGVEYDPVCEENFLLNAGLNNVSDRVCFVLSPNPKEGMEEGMAHEFAAPDLIVCNMLSERFTPLLGKLRSIDRPVVLSGFMLGEREAVRASVTSQGFRVAEEFELDEWGAYLCLPK